MLLPIHTLEKMAANAPDNFASGPDHDSAEQEKTSVSGSAGRPPSAKPSRSPATPSNQTKKTSSASHSGPKTPAPAKPVSEEKVALEPARPDNVQSEAGEMLVDERDQFYSDLNDYMAMTEVEIEVQPLIAGRQIEAWQLAQAVSAQNVPSEEIDWTQVSEELGYDWTENQSAPGDIRAWYEQNLDDFQKAMDSYAQEAMGGQGQEEEERDHHDEESTATTSKLLSPPGYVPASPAAGRKRRLSRTDEIPSTPDEAVRVVRPRLDIADFRSPSLGEPQEDSQAVRFETQPIQPAQLSTQHSSMDVTPSQQLHLEAVSTSPIPIRLGQEPTARPGGRKSEPAADPPSYQPANKPSRRSLPTTFRPHSSKAPPATDDGRKLTSIPEWVDHYQSLGYPLRVVIEALKRTTMIVGGDAATVMESLRQTKGVPVDLRGVWTDRDDQGLRMVESMGKGGGAGPNAAQKERFAARVNAEVARLRGKHGQRGLELRRRFLADGGMD